MLVAFTAHFKVVVFVFLPFWYFTLTLIMVLPIFLAVSGRNAEKEKNYGQQITIVLNKNSGFPLIP